LFVFLESLLENIVKIFLKAIHKNCARHIYANLWKKGFHNLKFKIRFWSAFRSYTNISYCNYMKKIGDVDNDTLNWLKNIPLKTWKDKLHWMMIVDWYCWWSFFSVITHFLIVNVLFIWMILMILLRNSCCQGSLNNIDICWSLFTYLQNMSLRHSVSTFS
jgi:hypothetical protein